MKFVVFESDSGCRFRCTEAQQETLEKLQKIVRGGIGTVHGYVMTSDRTVPEKADVQFLTAFSTKRLYERKLAALEDITFEDVAPNLTAPKLTALTEAERRKTFDERKQKEMDSLRKSIEGTDRSDAHRQAHDRCYCEIGPGVKVHYRTERRPDDGIKEPIMVNGLPVVESIMLTIIEIKRHVIEPGEYKKVNSGAPVLTSNAIKRTMNLRSTNLKTLSLKEDNFDSLVVDHNTFLPEHVEGIPSDLFIR